MSEQSNFGTTQHSDTGLKREQDNSCRFHDLYKPLDPFLQVLSLSLPPSLSFSFHSPRGGGFLDNLSPELLVGVFDLGRRPPPKRHARRWPVVARSVEVGIAHPVGFSRRSMWRGPIEIE